jgi:hypothetical protein
MLGPIPPPGMGSGRLRLPDSTKRPLPPLADSAAAFVVPRVARGLQRRRFAVGARITVRSICDYAAALACAVSRPANRFQQRRMVAVGLVGVGGSELRERQIE